VKKPYLKSLAALTLALLLLLPLATVVTRAETPAILRTAWISDIHYFPEDMAGGYTDAFTEGNIIGHPIEQTPGTLRSALAAITSKKNDIDYLLIPGDLTREGEYMGHVGLAEILLDFEAETGIPVAVIPGNHDIDNGGAADFKSGQKERAQMTTVQDFYDIYKDLGYDFNNLARFSTDLEVEGALSYAADLGSKYRLIALDTWRRRISPELRAWVVEQSEAAVAAGKTVVAMGHHNLNEQINGQLIIMQNQGIENMREISEQFADAGMHFYFSGHLHMSEISPWVSDRGETLYDIIVPGLYSFPGDYRIVNFSALNGRIEADVKSFPVDEVLPVTANHITYTPSYYPYSLEFSFGYKGEGMIGMTKGNLQKELTKMLRDLKNSGGIEGLVKQSVDLGPLNALFKFLDDRLINDPQTIIDLIEPLIDEVFALPVSTLPCTRFIDVLGFGSPDRPGTVEDVANSAIVYMFWKNENYKPADDPFMQDVLLRLKNGELIDQILNFVLPRVLAFLGDDALPLLIDSKLISGALSGALKTLGCPFLTVPLLALVATPDIRATVSQSLYDVASMVITSTSPTGSGNGLLTYNGTVTVPTGPRTFRTPYDLSVTLSKDRKSAEIVWYTKASVKSTALTLTDADGNAVSGVNIEYGAAEETEIKVEAIDLSVAQLMGHNMRAAKHTVKLTGLTPGKKYIFKAGDSEFGWWDVPRDLVTAKESQILNFFQKVINWIRGFFESIRTSWKNWMVFL